MKLKIYTAIAFSFCASLFAATPSFYSFDTNDFTVTPSLTNPLTIHSKGSGGTNVFNTIIVTNLYMTTNTYITINGDTNAAGLWINNSGNYIPSVTQNQLTATNIIGVQMLQAYGAFLLEALTSTGLNAGLNDVSAITNSVLWVTGFDSDPANSSMRLDYGNGQGQILVIQNHADNSGFTMRNGEALFNSLPGAYQILNGDWVTSHKGDCLLLYNNGQSWAEIGRMSGTTNNTGSSLWESVAGVLRPLGHSLGTNQFTIAESTGWTGTGTNAFLDDGTFGAIASLNPTDGYVPYRFNAYSFEDSPLYRVDASTVAVMHDSTNSIELLGGNVGEIWFHAPVGSPSVIKSDTELYYDLEGNGSRFRMGNLLFTPLTTSQASLGAAATPWQWAYTDSIGWGGHTASFDSAGGANPEGVVTADPGSIWRNTSAGSVWRKATGVGNTGWIEFSSTAINPTDNYIPFRTNSTTFLNSPWYVTSTNASIDSQIIFGPGTTNVLYRNGEHLFYTNGAANVDIKINNGSGKTAAFGLNAGGQAELRAEGTANAVSLSNGTDILTLFSNGFYPATYPISLGSSANPWGPNFYMAGFLSGTNYSRLYLNHSGTNGSVILDSQGSGTAGSGRPFAFRIDGTNYLAIRQVSGQPYLDLVNTGTSTTGSITESSGQLTVSDSSSVGLNAGSQSLVTSSGGNASLSRGTSTNSFKIYGYVSGGDASYLLFGHTGTNGASVYSSIGSGTAGVGRPHEFYIGTTNVMKLSHSSTADDTDLLLWDVTAGSLQRVSRGAADSGGVGYRALRIPN